MNFESLRQKYKKFIYKDFKITEDKESINITYYFEIPGLTKFEPNIQIMKKNIKYKSIDNEYIRNIVFNLGMIEVISYWKCVCSENVIIECGNLNGEQKQWFKKLYYNGTGEFRYINNIHIEQEKFVNFVTNKEVESIVPEIPSTDILSGYIIPVGGGKDSVVTLEKLKEEKRNNYCLTVGGKEPVLECCKIAGYNDNQIIEVKRTIDANLLELNKEGYLNGHTPFSSVLAFLSYLIAYLTNKKYGKLTVLEKTNKRQDGGSIVWKCKCDCGNIVEISSKRLQAGINVSCGCYQKERQKYSMNKLHDGQFIDNTNLISRQKANSNSKSGVRGVHWCKSKRKWIATLNFQKKLVLNESFDDLNKAIQARKEAEEEYFKPILDKYKKLD